MGDVVNREKILDGLYFIKNWKCNGDAEMHKVIESAIEELELMDADGCKGCTYEGAEEWEMPCKKCKRASKDYYRALRSEPST